MCCVYCDVSDGTDSIRCFKCGRPLVTVKEYENLKKSLDNVSGEC